jgi:hypothetical protein
MPDNVDTVIWAPGDEWSYHSKHAEQFTNIDKLYIVVHLVGQLLTYIVLIITQVQRLIAVLYKTEFCDSGWNKVKVGSDVLVY